MSSSITWPLGAISPSHHQEFETGSDTGGLPKRRSGLQNQPRRCKRRRSESSEHISRDENETDRITSLLETIATLKGQVSCLQQLLYCHTPQLATRHSCRAVSCKKDFKRLEYLYRHIRDQQHDHTHKPLAGLINETHCVRCSKTYRRPTDLVKHEKRAHHETYISRLDRFLSPLVLPSPPSSTSGAVDDARSSPDTDVAVFRRSRSNSESNRDYSGHPAEHPPASQTGASPRVASMPPIRAMSPIRSAEDASVLGELEDSQAMVHTGASPIVIAPAGINTDSGAGCDSNLSVWEENPVATDTFPTVLTNPPYDSSGFDSWDHLYLDEHGSMQWNGVYVDGCGSFLWDGLYVDENGLLQSVGVGTWDDLHSSALAIN